MSQRHFSLTTDRYILLPGTIGFSTTEGKLLFLQRQVLNQGSEGENTQCLLRQIQQKTEIQKKCTA